MKQKKHTPARRKSSTVARQLSIQPTAADHALARLLSGLYHGKQTPEVITSAIFDIFHRLATYHRVSLPRNFTRYWLPYWAAFLALNRRQRHSVTHVSFSFEPTPEREAELDAEEKREAEIEAIFSFLHDPKLPADVSDAVGDKMAEFLNPFSPLQCLETFRIAYSLALEAAAEKEGAR